MFAQDRCGLSLRQLRCCLCAHVSNLSVVFLLYAGLLEFARVAWGAEHKLGTGWLILPDGVNFLGDPELGTTIHVREPNGALREALDIYKTQGIKHVVVSGNPGVGKSAFALFMLMW